MGAFNGLAVPVLFEINQKVKSNLHYSCVILPKCVASVEPIFAT